MGKQHTVLCPGIPLRREISNPWFQLGGQRFQVRPRENRIVRMVSSGAPVYRSAAKSKPAPGGSKGPQRNGTTTGESPPTKSAKRPGVEVAADTSNSVAAPVPLRLGFDDATRYADVAGKDTLGSTSDPAKSTNVVPAGAFRAWDGHVIPLASIPSSHRATIRPQDMGSVNVNKDGNPAPPQDMNVTAASACAEETNGGAPAGASLPNNAAGGEPEKTIPVLKALAPFQSGVGDVYNP